MSKSFFTEVFIVRYGQGLYKLVIPCAFKIEPEHIPLIADPANKESFAESAAYTAGWWIGICQNYSIAIKKVEIILPPLMEYMPIAEDLYKEFKEDNVELEITIGLKIDVMEENIQQDMEYIKERLSMLQQRSFGNN